MTAAAVKERPILFSAPMVRAILDGRKTQTRRLCKPLLQSFPYASRAKNGLFTFWHRADPNGKWFEDCTDPFDCPYGVPGERLWVREAWQQVYEIDGGKKIMPTPAEVSYGQLMYAADCPDGVHPPRWRQSIHMPRWASRITLELVDVRVQRLTSMSWVDAVAEGIKDPRRSALRTHPETGCVEQFATLWDSINGPGSWASNPWVWALTFRRIER